MSRLPPQPDCRPVRLSQALKPGAVIEAARLVYRLPTAPYVAPPPAE